MWGIYISIVLVYFLVAASACLGQTTTITGFVKDVTGSIVATGKLSFQLYPGSDATISGIARYTLNTTNCAINLPALSSISRSGNVVSATLTAVPTQPFSVGDVVGVTGVTDSSYNSSQASGFTLTSVTGSGQNLQWSQTGSNSSSTAGNVGGIMGKSGTGACLITTTTSLMPPGYWYLVKVWPNQVATSQFTMYAVNSSYDLSTIVPTPTTSPIQNFVDVFSNQTIGGNKTFTGSTVFSGAVGFNNGNLSGIQSLSANSGAAQSGFIRCANNTNCVVSRNAGGNGDIVLLALGADNRIYVAGASGTNPIVLNGATLMGGALNVAGQGLQGTAFKQQIFTSSGTFTIPAGITAVKVTVVGGGGAGGGSSATNEGSGGGAGGAGIKWLTGLTPGNTLTVTIGTGGSGVSSGTGNSGASSSVSSGTQTITTISASGGGGGFPNTTTIAFQGAGGGSAGSGGDLNLAGSPGYPNHTNGVSGDGGASILGGGGTGTGGQPGINAVTPGSGGSGSAGGANGAGGSGANGIVIFEWVN